MFFGQSWVLWGLFAAGLPILIHLINHWRHKSMPWAAMTFLFKASREIKGRKRIVHYLILALRALAVVAIVMAMARPKLSGFFSFFGTGGADQIVVLADRSLSMETRGEGGALTPRELGLEQIRETMKAMPETRFYVMESAGQKIWEVENNDLLTNVSDLSATETMADIPQMLLKAGRYIDDNFTGNSEIWVLADRQGVSWKPTSDLWSAFSRRWGATEEQANGQNSDSNQHGNENSPIRGGNKDDEVQRLAVRSLLMDSPATGNYAVRVHSAKVREGELILDMEIVGEDAGSTEAKRTIPMTISIDGGRLSESVTIQGESTRLHRTIPMSGNVRSGYGFVAIEHDGNALDDVFFFVYEEDKPVKVAVIGGDGISESESSTILQKMIAPKALATRVLETPNLAQLTKSSLLSYGVVIYEGQLPSGEQAKLLKEYVEAGGILVCLPDKTETGKGESFLGMKWGEPEEFVSTANERGKNNDKEAVEEEDALENQSDIEYFSIKNWQRGEGLLRDDAEGASLPLEVVHAQVRVPIEGDGVTLADWGGGVPAVVRKSVGDGMLIFVGTTADYEWSNLGDGALMIPLFQRLIEQAGLRFSLPTSVDLESDEARMSQAGARVRVDDYVKYDGLKQSEYATGVYRVDNRLLALNRPLMEDNRTELERDEIKKLFGGVAYRELMATGIEEEEPATLVRDVWRWFLIAALLLLLSEGLLTLPRRLTLPSRNKDFNANKKKGGA